MEEKKAPPKAMSPMAPLLLSATGEFLLIVGVFFAMFGAASYISVVIGIEGSGHIILAILLMIAGAILLTRSRAQMRIRMVKSAPPQMPAMPQEPKDNEYGAYR